MTEPDHQQRQVRLSLASLIVSILALVASITSPFVAYYWLQGSLRVYELKRNAFVVEGSIGTSPLDCPDFPNWDKGDTKSVTYFLDMKNSGSLPIEKVRVSLEKGFRFEITRKLALDLDPKNIRTHPPLLFEIQKNDKGVLLTFKDAIPPYESILLTLAEYSRVNKNTNLRNLAPAVWVLSEVSQMSISWFANDVLEFEFDCP
jgi:hypothetical protein